LRKMDREFKQSSESLSRDSGVDFHILVLVTPKN